MGSIENGHFAMNGGDGPLSYVKNSSYQRVLEVAKPIIEEEIATKLEIPSTQNAFCIADFGCSTGENSFQAMHIIMEAIKRKHESSDLKIPEFHLFLNDVVTNDFNTLFSSLPHDRNYNVAAVPGDFHRRLLPPSSIHFAFSSWSLHWLTEVPKAVTDGGSPAWKGGEILYTRERKEVCDAYLDQFERDVESFLKCRAVEMAEGGIVALLIPGVPAFWDPQKDLPLRRWSNLSDLPYLTWPKRSSEAEIDTFNIPYYFPSPEELRATLQKSYSFSIEKMEILKTGTFLTAKGRAACIRAVHQTMLSHHFGGEIVDELFELYEDKLAASPVFRKPDNDTTLVLLAILKRIIV